MLVKCLFLSDTLILCVTSICINEAVPVVRSAILVYFCPRYCASLFCVINQFHPLDSLCCQIQNGLHKVDEAPESTHTSPHSPTDSKDATASATSQFQPTEFASAASTDEASVNLPRDGSSTFLFAMNAGNLTLGSQCLHDFCVLHSHCFTQPRAHCAQVASVNVCVWATSWFFICRTGRSWILCLSTHIQHVGIQCAVCTYFRLQMNNW